MEVSDSNPLLPSSFDPEGMEEGEDQNSFIDAEDLPLEIEEILYYGETDEEAFARINEKLSEAVVDSTRAEEFKKIEQVISFLIDNLEEGKYPQEIKALQSLLQTHPILQSVSLYQIKNNISQIVEFVLHQIISVDEEEIKSWIPDYDEMEKPKYFQHLLKLALLYQTIDRIEHSPRREELLEELIEELFELEDYNKALELTQKIMSQDCRDRLLRRFAHELTQTKHYKRAIECANLLSVEKDRFDAIRELLKGSEFPASNSLLLAMAPNVKSEASDSLIKDLKTYFKTDHS